MDVMKNCHRNIAKCHVLVFIALMAIVTFSMTGCGSSGDDIFISDTKSYEEPIIPSTEKEKKEIISDGAFPLNGSLASSYGRTTYYIPSKTFENDTNVLFRLDALEEYKTKSGDNDFLYKNADSPVLTIQATDSSGNNYKTVEKPVSISLPVFIPEMLDSRASVRSSYDSSDYVIAIKDLTEINSKWQYQNVFMNSFYSPASSTVRAYMDGKLRVVIETRIPCCSLIIFSRENLVAENQSLYCGILKSLTVEKSSEKIEVENATDDDFVYAGDLELTACVEVENEILFKKGVMNAEINFDTDTYDRASGIKVNENPVFASVEGPYAANKHHHTLKLSNLKVSDAETNSGTKAAFKFVVGLNGFKKSEFPDCFKVRFAFNVGYGYFNYCTSSEYVVRLNTIEKEEPESDLEADETDTQTDTETSFKF